MDGGGIIDCGRPSVHRPSTLLPRQTAMTAPIPSSLPFSKTRALGNQLFLSGDMTIAGRAA